MLKMLISKQLLLEPGFIDRIAKTASFLYKEYDIKKKGGGSRRISHPSKELKLIQRWLSDIIIESFPIHPAAKAYKKNTNIMDNARVHVKSKFLLRMDFSDFFPSISFHDVSHFLRNSRQHLPRHWGNEDDLLFCKLVCRRNQLTIGAPSSPSLSNRMCYKLDEKLYEMALDKQCKYSRYADDLFFSTSSPGVLKSLPPLVERIVQQLQIPSNLMINKSKTLDLSTKHKRTVTGLVLSSDGKISIGRHKKRLIRHWIHQFSNLSKKEKLYLQGYLNFVQAVEPELIDRLYLKYGQDQMDLVFSPIDHNS